MEGQDEVSAREQHFHSQVRESTMNKKMKMPSSTGFRCF
ncbi:LMBR1 isoform 18 [Pan troglodytes]|uniref:Limb development membrane protein 1 n=3 Tax=Hominidae TaxID=9604 RepID=F8WCL1_HUMAN|nr:LMBR1 isoform 18 [Pan troglodytes]PNJ31241.1 LMBR1 isoform 17 [Pongo abelii]